MDNLTKRGNNILHEGRYNGIKKECRMGNTIVAGLGLRGNDTTFIISNVPLSIRDILIRGLSQLGMEHGMNIRCMLSLSFRNYTSDLFQRLLKPDGTWIDNVAGLVTQVLSLLSSLPKEELDEVLEDNVCPSSILMDSQLRMKGEMTNA